MYDISISKINDIVLKFNRDSNTLLWTLQMFSIIFGWQYWHLFKSRTIIPLTTFIALKFKRFKYKLTKIPEFTDALFQLCEVFLSGSNQYRILHWLKRVVYQRKILSCTKKRRKNAFYLYRIRISNVKLFETTHKN